MQDAEYNLQRAYLPGTSVNEGNKKQCIWGCVASQMLLLMCKSETPRGERQSVPCVATGAHQVLFERVGDGVPDKLIAQGGHDHLDARAYTNDRDVAKGSGGHDLLRVNDGDTMDAAIGGPGSDLCVVDAAIEAADTCEGVIFR
jgi:hypothetical protein